MNDAAVATMILKSDRPTASNSLKEVFDETKKDPEFKNLFRNELLK